MDYSLMDEWLLANCFRSYGGSAHFYTIKSLVLAVAEVGIPSIWRVQRVPLHYRTCSYGFSGLAGGFRQSFLP